MVEGAGSSHPNALPAGSELLEYRILSVLGADGFGISYRAQDTILHREVAIKEYFPSDLALRSPDGTVAPSGAATEANFRKGLNQFLVEASMLSGTGGLVGVLLSAAVAVIVRATTPVPMRVPISAVVIGVGLSTVVGLFFGIYPARRAARLDPIEALRAEN